MKEQENGIREWRYCQVRVGGGVKERGERVGVEKGSELGKELVIEGKEGRM